MAKADGTPEEESKQTNILVVEDDLFLRNLLIKKLMSEGFGIWEAVDGPAMLKTLETKKPHLIILDLLLPGIDGFELLTRVKKDQNLSSIPVIVLSNLSSQEDISRATSLGAADYIVKANFTLEEIVERIKKLLKEKYFDVG